MSIRRLAAGLAALLGAAGANAEVPLADFARHVQYSSVEISPDGEYIAADAVIGNRRSLALIRLSDMKATRIVPRGDEITSFTWVGKQRLMYTVGTAVGGHEKPMGTGELYFVDADGGRNEILFGFRAGKEQTGSNIKSAKPEQASAFLIDDLRDDDDNILIAVRDWKTSDETAPVGVYKFDVSNGLKKRLFFSPLSYASGFLADNAGVIRFAYGIDVNNRWQVRYRSKDGGDWTTAFDGADAPGQPKPLAFDRDDKTVYWSCEPEGKIGGLCTWNAEERNLKPIWSAKDVEMNSLLTDFDGTTVVGVRAYPARSAIGVVNKKTPMIEALTMLMQQFPGETVAITSSTKDGKRAIVAVYSDVNPGEFFLFERENKKLVPLLKRAEKINPEQMASMEPIKLKSRDGLDLSGYLTRPLGQEQGKNLPLVVYVHGGPFGVRDYWSYDPTVQMLASRGYAVLQVNFRGSGGYGHAFELAGYRQWGATMQDDVTDATKWAIEQGIADAKRICIYGGSYGGYAALMGVVREPDLYRCAIGDAGVYDLRLMLTRGDIQSTTYGENYIKEAIGEDTALLATRSPITHVDKIKANLMLVVGGQDKRVPPIHGESLRAALEKRGVKPEWLYQRTEAHGFYDEKNIEELYARVLAFLDANIGGKTPPAL